ncbi:restriction endonuclease subunit S [Pseudomonas protegens]|uniref:restriction endonuclease subunit S n=1 Tax=Pseudomonas protegens TaxID=380021 RepID=UPI001967A8E1|nr:restriction endonuclease subunit S [Pseudomonas protegens]
MMPAAYPSYRQPKMQWLPPVPDHWGEERAKVFFREVDERSRTGEEELLSVSHLTGVTPRSQKKVTMFKAASYVGHKICRPGDIVINTLWAWMAALGAARHTGLVSPAYGIYRPHKADSFNPAYLDYLLRTRAYVAEYIGRSTGIRASRLRLYPNQFLDISLIQPPRTEQDQIVGYLRAQDAHIARLIKAKRELMSLLTEQKLHIIDHALTRGLDESVTLTPSGIDWLGDVPEHWDISRLGACIKTSRAGVWGSDPSDKNQPDQLICVRVADFDMDRLAVGTEKLTVRAVTQSERSGRLLCPGDILLEKSGGGEKTPVGRVVAFTLDKVSVCSNFVARLVPNTQIVLPSFLLTLMNHLHARRIVTPYIKQTTGIQNLDSTAYFKIGIALPGLEEQEKIMRVLTEQCKPLNDAIMRSEEEIKLIREYRDRQIADVVTGQVDVQSWVPGPDDMVADEELAALGSDDELDIGVKEDDGDD